MAGTIASTKVQIPVSVVTEMVDKVKDSSVIAALSPAKPKLFVDDKHLVFTPTAEAEVVAEGAAKGSYEIALSSVEGKRVKVVTTTRVSEELKWADEDSKLEIVSNIMEDQTAAIARSLDYVVFHAVNPKTGAALPDYTAYTGKFAQVTATDDPVSDLDALVDALADYSINGIALSRKFAGDLRKLRVPSTGMRLYPEIPLSLDAGSLDGIRAATSNTVSGRRCTVDPKVKAIMGDWSVINWGLVRDMWSEVIEYGDPDNTGSDLKGHNQVAYRTEAVYSYAVLDPKALAVLKAE